MAKLETVPLAELKHRLPGKLMPLVEEYEEKLDKLGANLGAKLVLEKGDDPKDLRKALKAAAAALNRRIRFPFRGEEGSLSFYLEKAQGRRPKGEAGGAKKTGEAEEGRVEEGRRSQAGPNGPESGRMCDRPASLTGLAGRFFLTQAL